MAKRKLKFTYDAPVILSFVLACIAIFLVDTFLVKGYLTETIFVSPTSVKGTLPFSFSQFLSYPRLLLYVFSSESITLLLADLVLILILGPSIEEYYGSFIIGIMMGVSVLVSGVLNSCFSIQSLRGPTVIVFMMIFLNGFIALSKRNISISFIVIFLMFFAFEWIGNISGNTSVTTSLVSALVNVAGGLCGGLFACIASPKARAEKRYNNKTEEKPANAASKKRTLRSRIKKGNGNSSDATVVSSSGDSEETIILQ